MEPSRDIMSLSESIQKGIASEQDLGLALRTVQTALGCELINSIELVHKRNQELDILLGKCVLKYTQKVEEGLDSDTIDREELFETITAIQKNQMAVLELQRKVVQSPNKIFSDDLLSPEERKLLTLLKSFKTKQDKEDFLKAVQKALTDQGSNDFEDQ